MQTGMQVVTFTIQGAPTPEQGWFLPSRSLDVLSSNECKFLLPLCAPFVKNRSKVGGFGSCFVLFLKPGWHFDFDYELLGTDTSLAVHIHDNLITIILADTSVTFRAKTMNRNNLW